MARREAGHSSETLEPVALVDEEPSAPTSTPGSASAPEPDTSQRTPTKHRRGLLAAVAAAAVVAVVVASLVQEDTDGGRASATTVPVTATTDSGRVSPTTFLDDTQPGAAVGYFGAGIALEGELVTAGRDGVRVIDLATGAVRRDDSVDSGIDVVLATADGTLLGRRGNSFVIRAPGAGVFDELDADTVALAPPNDLWVAHEGSTEWRRLRDDRIVDPGRRSVVGATALGFVTTDGLDRLFIDPFEAGATVHLAASPARLLAASADRVAFTIVHECTATCPVHVRDLATDVEIDWYTVQARRSLLGATLVSIDSAAFSPDGTRLALVREDPDRDAPEHVDLVDLTDGRRVTHSHREVPALEPGTNQWGRGEIVRNRATWTPDSQAVTIIGNDRRLMLLPFGDRRALLSTHEFTTIRSIASTAGAISAGRLNTTITRPERTAFIPGAGDARIAFVTNDGRVFHEIRLESRSLRELELPAPESGGDDRSFDGVFVGEAVRADGAWIVPINGVAQLIGDDDKISTLGPATRVHPSPRGYWLLRDRAGGTEVREYSAGTLSPLLVTLHQPVFGSVTTGLVTIIAADPTDFTRFVAFDPHTGASRVLPIDAQTQDDTRFGGRFATSLPVDNPGGRYPRVAFDIVTGVPLVDGLAYYPYALSPNGRWLVARSSNGTTRYDLERGTAERVRISLESDWRIANNGTIVALDFGVDVVSVIAPGQTRRIDFSDTSFLRDEQWALA